jgi:hypothetical protein
MPGVARVSHGIVRAFEYRIVPKCARHADGVDQAATDWDGGRLLQPALCPP